MMRGDLRLWRSPKSWVPSLEHEVSWLDYTILYWHILLYNQQIHSMRNVLLRPKVVLNLKRMWPKVFLGIAARYDRYKRIFIKCTKSNHSNHFKVFFYIRISHLFTSWSYWVYMNQNHWIIRTKKDFIYGSIPLL